MRKLIARILLVLLAKISYIAWALESSACGRASQTLTSRLTHAYHTGHWPWHAAIFHHHTHSTYECGGTVISQNWVLTAAHCVSRNGMPIEPHEITVSLGRLNLAADESRTEQSFNITEIVLHENYNSIYLDNDIALVRLSHTATFNNFVGPICLWKPNETEYSRVTNKVGKVVGWGKTETYELSNMLREASFQAVSPLACLVSNRNFYGTYLTERNFCAGQRNGTSVCSGDSGGSLVFEENGRYYIRGIVSSSPSKTNHTTQQWDCDTMEYSIFTDVAMYLKWIGDRIGTTIESTTECQTKVRCVKDNLFRSGQGCKVDVDPSKRRCKIIFDSDSNIGSLRIAGEFESIPDLSDAINKFENLELLRLFNIKLKVVERRRLSAFRRIKWLYLTDNQIAKLDANTFDDLKGLDSLSLDNNTISELPPDIFRGLNNLISIHLDGNEIEILPQGLFRDNKQLEYIHLNRNQLKELPGDAFNGLFNLVFLTLDGNQLGILPQGLFRDNRSLGTIGLKDNRIKTIESDFSHLSRLRKLDMRGNVCIDEDLGSSDLREKINKIRTKCSR